MLRTTVAALAVVVASPALAETSAGEEDLREINEELADFNCGPVEAAEQETSYLFEMDDVACAAHQYDIKVRKVDDAHIIVSMTYDGPLEGDAAPTEDDIARIMTVLEELQCEMDPDDIEKEADGFELDDVYCTTGRYDIDLNASFEETNRRAEY
ncbi:hypothetical protein JANAI62_05400 [Jannaschia pagri]|uniref:PepSY domain-containing protein n=1 Tax=Jannaschia pagri TaxID=2829797 RepID=A0ABQ4NHN6_9RHOB|nr:MULTISPECIES: hypothetical protein [unclassified Jannaschia]GIT89976.1 hypothetical protein JANAI61_04340 [Jannaschia sp. AI_61]GIT93917.1 hypothetical protein JANAI62_05400 [Jannaschia sp. AI_62]